MYAHAYVRMLHALAGPETEVLLVDRRGDDGLAPQVTDDAA